MLKHLIALQTRIAAFRDEERGATAVEYGLLVALIAGAVIAVIGFLGADVLDLFNDVENNINGNQG